MGFEPTIRLNTEYAISNRAPSTTRTPLRLRRFLFWHRFKNRQIDPREVVCKRADKDILLLDRLSYNISSLGQPFSNQICSQPKGRQDIQTFMYPSVANPKFQAPRSESRAFMVPSLANSKFRVPRSELPAFMYPSVANHNRTIRQTKSQERYNSPNVR